MWISILYVLGLFKGSFSLFNAFSMPFLCFIPFLYTVTIRVSYLLLTIDMLLKKLKELYTLLLSPSLTGLMV